MNVSPDFIFLWEGISFFFQILAVSLDVLYHQIFSGQLIVIWKMVYNPKEENQLLNIKVLNTEYVSVHDELKQIILQTHIYRWWSLVVIGD